MRTGVTRIRRIPPYKPHRDRPVYWRLSWGDSNHFATSDPGAWPPSESGPRTKAGERQPLKKRTSAAQKKKCHHTLNPWSIRAGRWSSGYDAALTRRRSAVRFRLGPFFHQACGWRAPLPQAGCVVISAFRDRSRNGAVDVLSRGPYPSRLESHYGSHLQAQLFGCEQVIVAPEHPAVHVPFPRDEGVPRDAAFHVRPGLCVPFSYIGKARDVQ